MTTNDPILNGLLKEIADPDPEVCKSAASSLCQKYPSQALQPLCLLLADRHAPVRTHAAKQLGILKNTGAVKPLLLQLNDPNIRVRARIIKTLGILKDPSAVQPLINELRDSRFVIKVAALNALRTMRCKQAVPALLALLPSTDDRICNATLETLGRLGDPGVVPTLLGMLPQGNDNVLPTLLKVIGNLGNEVAISPLSAFITRRCASSQQPMDDNVFMQAFQALGKIGGNRAVRELLTFYHDPALSARLQIYVTLALGTVKQVSGEAREEAIILWLECLQASDIRSSHAVEALGGTFKDKRAVEPLIALLATDRYPVFLEVSRSLSRLGDPRAIEPLMQEIKKNRDPAMVHFAIEALGRLKARNAVELLITLLQPAVGRYDMQQDALIMALDAIGDPRAIQALSVPFSNPSRQFLANQALTKLKQRQAIFNKPVKQ
ncbi:MAG TPA: HEAT repeat domain-containing protein [Ktedonobacteraceae bacterium]|nr:HEAT repeat domain-containing protein [Ktedonobacteraceae bacterium]